MGNNFMFKGNLRLDIIKTLIVLFLAFVLIINFIAFSQTTPEEVKAKIADLVKNPDAKFLETIIFYVSIILSIIGFIWIAKIAYDIITGKRPITKKINNQEAKIFFLRRDVIPLLLIFSPIFLPSFYSFLIGFGFIHSFLAFAFIVVVIGGVLEYLAYLSVLRSAGSDDSMMTMAKIYSSLGSLIIFIGISMVAIFLFINYIPIQFRSVEFAPCKTYAGWIEMTSCFLTGYYAKPRDILSQVSFLIFAVILPFAFLFAFTYGIFNAIGLPSFFGGDQGLGKNITRVMAFIIALYGARQLIGYFLLDLFAYGMWGGVAVLMAAILSIIPKRIIDGIISKIKVIEQQTLLKLMSDIQKSIEERLLPRLESMERNLNSLAQSVQKLDKEYVSNVVSAIKNVFQTDIQPVISQIRAAFDEHKDKLQQLEGSVNTALERLNSLLNAVNTVLRIIEEQGVKVDEETKRTLKDMKNWIEAAVDFLMDIYIRQARQNR